MSATMISNQRSLMISSTDGRIIEQMQTNKNPSPFQTFNISSKKMKNKSFICVICGSLAIRRIFGIITCESCKLFFRRNALRNSLRFACCYNNACEITFETQRCCSACRLNKCFTNRMKCDGLLRAKEKPTTHRRTKENHRLILHTTNPISGQKFPLRLPTHRNHLITRRNTDLTKLPSQPTILSSADLQLIETVQIAFEKRIEPAVHDNLWSTFPTNLLQHVNSRSIPAVCLLTFFQQIPEFNQLHVNDKIILAKYNLMSLVILNCALSYKIDTQQIIETDATAPWNSPVLQTMHGNDIYMQVKTIFSSFVYIVQYDQRIIQLMLIVLILTKGLSTSDGEIEPILNDSMTVYRAHNYYTELLWNYMEAAHGPEQAFCIFSKLIAQFLTWQKLEKKHRYNVEQSLSTTGEIG